MLGNHSENESWKTKVLTVLDNMIQLDCREIKKANEYVYLGHIKTLSKQNQ